jgi:hypothetical protein
MIPGVDTRITKWFDFQKTAIAERQTVPLHHALRSGFHFTVSLSAAQHGMKFVPHNIPYHFPLF